MDTNTNKKRSFFERLTGSMSDEEMEEQQKVPVKKDLKKNGTKGESNWMEEEIEEQSVEKERRRNGRTCKIILLKRIKGHY